MNIDLHYCILGLGVTGVSCLEFFTKKNIKKITAVDLKNNHELLLLKQKYPKVNFVLGEFKIPDNVDCLVLSPGIDPALPIIQHAIQQGTYLTNDINLFLEEINILKQSKAIKIAAVTGTNGKTTVVNVLAKMASEHNINYALCGNVGEPVLNCLANNVSLYILELSSFQLELIDSLSCNQIFDVACILNITPDHLDRYVDFTAYCIAKLNIYKQAKHIVYYTGDHEISLNGLKKYSELIGMSSFGITPDLTYKSLYFGVDVESKWLTAETKKLLAISEISLYGEHNVLNVLACLAIGEKLGFSFSNMITVLKNFRGLEHRCQVIGTFAGIKWINDSKGTNVGATIAAIKSIIKNSNRKLIIILGGLNKNIDLSVLKPAVSTNCKAAILIGACKNQLKDILIATVDCYIADSLKMAVCLAQQIAKVDDTVLFSPACASFDMFNDYKHRGEVFKQCVLELNNVKTTTI